MRIDVADRYRDAFRKAGPGCGLGRQASSSITKLPYAVRQLRLGEAGKLRVEGRLEVAARIGAVLQDSLVARGAGVAHVLAAQLPDDPVRGLHPVVHAVVQLRVFLHELQCLGVLPLRGDEAAIARKPTLRPLARERVDTVSLSLARVVLPEFHVGVRPVLKTGDFAQRGAVCEYRERGGGGEVCRNAHDQGGVDAGRGHSVGHCPAQHFAIVVGHLQRPFGGQRCAGGREFRVHDGVRIVVHSAAEFGAVCRINDERSA